MGQLEQNVRTIQQAHDAVVAERDGLREEVDELSEELERVQAEREEERKSNLCTRFEKDSICTLRRCRKMHQYGDRQVRFEDGAKE